jgi:pre-60S factor REI1
MSVSAPSGLSTTTASRTVSTSGDVKEDQVQEAGVTEPASVEPLKIEACIFCAHVAKSFEDNLLHMTNAHSFFVPDIEYIDNLEGLIKFLQAKVWEDNMCLLCNGHGRGFASAEAVRKHMQDKGHCMIDYSEDGRDEISEFFDFSTSYPDWEDVERCVSNGGVFFRMCSLCVSPVLCDPSQKFILRYALEKTVAGNA